MRLVGATPFLGPEEERLRLRDQRQGEIRIQVEPVSQRDSRGSPNSLDRVAVPLERYGCASVGAKLRPVGSCRDSTHQTDGYADGGEAQQRCSTHVSLLRFFLGVTTAVTVPIGHDVGDASGKEESTDRSGRPTIGTSRQNDAWARVVDEAGGAPD